MSMTPKRKVAIATLGCKVNQFESAAFLSDFEEKGLEQVDFSQPADIYVINTCAVTAKAAAQSRQLIRRALKNAPPGQPLPRVVVTGCYAQVAAQEILTLAPRTIRLVGNAAKDTLAAVALATSLPGTADIVIPPFLDIRREKEICHLTVRNFGGRTRAFLKVQDGCNNFCSYCIVPYARGRSRSLPAVEVLKQARAFTEGGHKELVVTGIHVGAYGQDLAPATDLLALMQQLASALPACRFRISSLEPTEISLELLQFIATTANCMNHLHIPLQSGDNTILKKMHRRYTGESFRDIVLAIHDRLPGAAIGVDVLVGFPGEDDMAFHNTEKLLESLPITYLHVFPYSRRPGTAAAVLPDQVPPAIKAARVAALRELGRQKRVAFYRRNLGQEHRVLTEGGPKRSNRLKGFTENYVPVFFDGPPSLSNQIVTVQLEKLTEGGVWGTIVPASTAG